MKSRARALLGAVITLTLLQVFFEDAVVFLGATRGASSSLSPIVYVAVPAIISLLLIALLLGGALLAPAGQRPMRRFKE